MDEWSPHHPRFGINPWPAKLTEFRDHQIQAVEETLAHFANGISTVYVSGPTGSGKTIYAEMVRRLLNPLHTLYSTPDKSNQSQIAREFPHYTVMWGRGNYQPVDPHPGATCADCMGKDCPMCPSRGQCPADLAKMRSLGSACSTVNTYFLLTETAYVGAYVKRAGQNPQRNLAIFDEADTIEGDVLRFVSAEFSYRLRKELGIGDKGPRFVTKPESWVEFFEQIVIPKAERAAMSLGPATGNVQIERQRKRFEDVVQRARFVRGEVGSGNWVFDHKGSTWSFKPVTVEKYAPPLLEPLAGKRILMSATLISADQLHRDLGFSGEHAVVEMPSTFPKENRRVIVAPVARMAHKEEETAYPIMAEALRRVLSMHPDERVLVHTVSGRLNSFLEAALDSPRVITYKFADQRDQALAKFRSTASAVLLAQSFARGISLDDDACRVQVICKVPFPYLGDAQVAAKVYGKGLAGQLWYDVATIRTLVQMTGRAVRHKDDWALSYILDAMFIEVYRKKKHLLPQYWREGLDMRFDVRSLTKPIPA